MQGRAFKNLATMAVAPFRERGFVQTVRSTVGVIYARQREREEGFDQRFGTDTDRAFSWSALEVSGDDVPTLWRYWPTLAAPFRRLLTEAEIPHERLVFVDLGSGKGRVLLLASDFPFRKIVGVELSPALHEVAQKNLRVYQSPAQRCFDFELICQDAALYPPPTEDCLLYLFQPFPAETFAAVLKNLRESIARTGRKVLIAYMNPLFHQQVLDGGFEVRARGEAKSPGEFDWTVYGNRS